VSPEVEREGIDLKKPEKTCRKAGSKPPDITRHYSMLRPEETRDVVERLADLIVDFVKKSGVDSLKIRTRDPDGIERSKPKPLQDGRTKKKNRQ
jgi:hypothetical protein